MNFQGIRNLSEQSINIDKIKGKYVRVVTDIAGFQGKFGRIIEANPCNDYIKIYFDETRETVKFSREALELVN